MAPVDPVKSFYVYQLKMYDVGDVETFYPVLYVNLIEGPLRSRNTVYVGRKRPYVVWTEERSTVQGISLLGFRILRTVSGDTYRITNN